MNPWVILGIVLAWGASLAGVGYWQRGDGATAERVAWQAREVKQVAAANAKIKELTDKAREREAQHAAQMDTIGTWLAKETQDAEDRQRRAVAGARALVLRNKPACPAGPGGGAAGTPAAATGAGDGAPACELPAATVRDLFQLVGDADRDVLQLAACQQVILSDRKEASP